MPFTKTEFEGLVIFHPVIRPDERGHFYEAYNDNIFEEAGIPRKFVQDNQAFSYYGVLRGMHYQLGEFAQAKLVRVVQGKVLDVVVDLREDSATYGKHYSIALSAENKKQLYVPRGFAHGYLVLSETAEFFYKCDNFYSPENEASLAWNDPTLNIDWQIDLAKVIIGKKDSINPLFGAHQKFIEWQES